MGGLHYPALARQRVRTVRTLMPFKQTGAPIYSSLLGGGRGSLEGRDLPMKDPAYNDRRKPRDELRKQHEPGGKDDP